MPCDLDGCRRDARHMVKGATEYGWFCEVHAELLVEAGWVHVEEATD